MKSQQIWRWLKYELLGSKPSLPNVAQVIVNRKPQCEIVWPKYEKTQHEPSYTQKYLRECDITIIWCRFGAVELSETESVLATSLIQHYLLRPRESEPTHLSDCAKFQKCLGNWLSNLFVLASSKILNNFFSNFSLLVNRLITKLNFQS